MTWAQSLNAKIVAGKAAQFVCQQESIAPVVPLGTRCEVAPFDKRTLQLNDVVLCRIGGWYKLCQITFVKGHRVEVMDGPKHRTWKIKMNQVTARLKILEGPGI